MFFPLTVNNNLNPIWERLAVMLHTLTFAFMRSALFALAITFSLVSVGEIALAQNKELSDRGKAADKNKNGVIDRDEARGPIASNFDDMDCNKSGTLDGGEIRGFFTGEECPKSSTTELSVKATPPPKQAKKVKTKKRRIRSVRVDPIISEPLSQTYPVLGRLVAQRSGDVAALINGAVSAMNVAVGDRVKKGQVIATLATGKLAAQREKFAASESTRRAMVQTAQAEHLKKVQELKRLTKLKRSSAFSRARYEDLERDVDSRKAALNERRSQLKEAKAELKRANIDLKNCRIRAPYDGVVTDKHTEVGSYVNVGARVVTLINDIDLEVEADVPANRLKALERDLQIRFSLRDGSVHRATVRSIIPRENARTRTRPVRFQPRFNGGLAPLAVNQSATVFIPVGKIRKVLTVHKDAIVYNDGKPTVRIIRRGKAFPRLIKIGEAVGQRYVVHTGLKLGDKVVTHGNETLPPGATVRILTSPPPNAALSSKKAP